MKDQPIIIVRKKRAHHGHHGGAWKVAYADFVTAMMAFFLVMWLVTQSKEVKASVAGYFRDPGVFDYEHSKGMVPGGPPGVEPNRPPEGSKPDPATLEQEQQALADAAQHIRQELTQAPEVATLRDQIEFSITPEGLRIELVERSGSSFFDSGSSALLGQSERILSIIAREVGRLSNDLVLEGHTDSLRYVNGNKYSNWELSADRANAARRVMEAAGLRGAQIRSVRGFADTQLHSDLAPTDPRNRRVSIVVRSQAAVQLEKALHPSH